MELIRPFVILVLECIGETSGGGGEELDGDVRREHVHSHVGFGGRVRVRRVGQHGQFHQTSRHIRTLCQVLPMLAQSAAAATVVRGGSSSLISLFSFVAFFLP